MHLHVQSSYNVCTNAARRDLTLPPFSNRPPDDWGGGTESSPMKIALSRFLEFVAGHNRREDNNPVHHNYCICGALKPHDERHEHESSSKTQPPARRVVNPARKEASFRIL